MQFSIIYKTLFTCNRFVLMNCILVSILSGCGVSPYAYRPQYVIDPIAIEKSISHDALELSIFISNKKISGYYGHDDENTNLSDCEGVADAYFLQDRDIILKVRNRTNQLGSKGIAESIYLDKFTALGESKRITMCIRLKGIRQTNGIVQYYVGWTTIGDESWGLKSDGVSKKSVINQIPSFTKLKIINAWWQDYKNRQLEFTTSTKNGNISSENAANFLYTYRGFAKDSVRTTEELIFSCLVNGKTDVANILADQITESGASLNPQIVAELKRRKVQR